MPHSPRWHEGAVWLLNSGLGELWRVDPATGRHDVVAALLGYLRGLCFAGPFALVGLSTIREKHLFGNLPVQARHPRLLCGAAVIDTRTGARCGLFRFTSGRTELYDVAFLPGVRRPMILGREQDATRQAVTPPTSLTGSAPAPSSQTRRRGRDRRGAASVSTHCDGDG